MRKRILSLVLVMVMVLGMLPSYAFGAETVETAQQDYELRTLTFEDADYKGDTNMVGKKDWSSLIDNPQYFGSLLYPQSGNTVYNWCDKGNTELTHTFTDEWGDHTYAGGGEAISNYVSGDLSTYGGYDSQLTVYKKGVTGLAISGGGHNGSDNFAVHYGYVDSSGFGGTKLQCLTFNDGKARVIDHMYVNNIDYALNCYYNGNGYTAAIGKDDWVKIVATGHHADGTTATAEIYLCNGPDNIVTDWTKWDLSGLGAITKLELNVMGSSDNGFGFSQPAYFAYDDVAVRFEKEPCLSVVDQAPEEGTVAAGGLYQLNLNQVFQDGDGHKLTYSFESEISNQHTKIQNGIFYFSAEQEGTYEVTLKADCATGKTQTHKLKIQVTKANEGIPAQYGYEETDKKSVTVTVTLSNNGYPVLGADGTVLSNLRVTVPYFDLGLYGLEDYYRYGTENGSGSYTGSDVIQRPTGLHLYIYLLERYYLGLPEEECCKGSSDVMEAADDTTVLYMDGTTAYESDGKQAINIIGSATSLYMQNFWGHDENLMYFRNHCYPYMSAGWGATSDYILLSDGDTWDVGMFSNWDFYHSGFFAKFDQNAYIADTGEQVTVKTEYWGTTSESTEFREKTGLKVGLYNEKWELVQELSYTGETNALTFEAPEKSGTYYLMALDSNAKDPEQACGAPATAVLTVAQVCQSHVDEDGDRYCDICHRLINTKPTLKEGVSATKEDVCILGYAYNLTELQTNTVFEDADGDTLNYTSYYYQRSTDGGKTWSERTNFQPSLFGFTTIQFTETTPGTYMYRFQAYDGYEYSDDTYTLTLRVSETVPMNFTFHVGKDYTGDYPELRVYKTAGTDENAQDYVGWFEKNGEVVYVYDPLAYTIAGDAQNGWTADGYELHDYQPVKFTDSAFGTEDESAVESGTVVSNYRMYYATTENGKYSVRAYAKNTETGAYDIFVGGQQLILPTEVNVDGGTGGGRDIYLRQLSIYTTTKKDGAYFSEKDYDVSINMSIMQCKPIHGAAYTDKNNRTCYPFMIYAAGNAATFTIVATPKVEGYAISQQINCTQAAGYSAVTKVVQIKESKTLTVKVPSNGEFAIYFQWNNFNSTKVEPESTVTDGDTTTLTYLLSAQNSNYTWRLSDTQGKLVTQAGWLKALSNDTEMEVSFKPEEELKSHDFSQLGTTVSMRDEADIQVFLDPTGFMSTEDTYRIRAFRMWELINSDTANIMVEPDFHVQMLQGNASDVKQVDGGNGGGNWIDVTPTGTDIVAVHYDAIDMDTSNNKTHAGFFPATNPERTGVFVISNAPEADADAHVVYNRNNTATSRSVEWDYNYDTWYYMDTDETPSLDFTVSGAAGQATVSFATVITDSSMTSTLSDWTNLQADEDGTYLVDLSTFRQAGAKGGTVIIRMTDSKGTSYQLVRVAQATVKSTENVSHPGEAIMPGDQVKVTFDGLYRSVNKVSGIFNPTVYNMRYTAVDTDGATEFIGTVGQYQQLDTAVITLTVPENLEFAENEETVDYAFTNGYIFGQMYSAADPFATMYHMTDAGVGTNFNAVTVAFCMQRLADIVIPVNRKVTYDVKFATVTADGTALDDCEIVLKDANGTEYSLTNGTARGIGFGDYTYRVMRNGYITVMNNFHLGSENQEQAVDGLLTMNVVMKTADASTWDGESKSQPQQVNGVYQIGTGAELAWFANAVNNGSTSIQACLTADIELCGYAWTPIGDASHKYTGTFDGNGHVIQNLFIDTTEDYQGLFGYLGAATVKNLGVTGSVTTTGMRAAGIAAYASNNAVITECFNAVNVTAKKWAGGIAGMLQSYKVTITDCYNTGSIQATGTEGYAGGIAAAGTGTNMGATMTNCYNVGTIRGAKNIGGISCYTEKNKYQNCYYLDGCCFGANNSGYGTAKTSEELKAMATTLGQSYTADTKEINSGYPVLYWQNPGVGDLDLDGEIKMNDVALMIQAIRGDAELSETQKALADVDGDREVKMQDVTLMIMYIRGQLETFPVETVS